MPTRRSSLGVVALLGLGHVAPSAWVEPAGLLKDLKPTDFVDLYAYLQTLAPRAGTNR